MILDLFFLDSEYEMEYVLRIEIDEECVFWAMSEVLNDNSWTLLF